MLDNDFLVKLLEFYGTKLYHRGQWKVHNWLRRMLNVSVDLDMEVIRPD